MKTKKRFFGILFSLALVLGLMLGMSLTAYADPPSESGGIGTAAINYPLWVGGTQVTSENASNIDGSNKASYDAATNTLTLNGAKITTGYKTTETIEDDTFHYGYGIYYNGEPELNVNLASGSNNRIEVNLQDCDQNNGIYSIKSAVSISGKGKLTVVQQTNGVDFGIFADKISINGCELDVTADYVGIYAFGRYMPGGINIQDAKVTANAPAAIFTLRSVTIDKNSTVVAAGKTQAMTDIVKNAIAGTGWTNVEGTEGKTNIPASKDGQRLEYKKVQFLAAPSATVKVKPAARKLTYNGKARKLVTAGKAEGGKMQYALGKDNKTAPTTGWAASIPKGTDAGTYYVWYKVVGDANHTDAAPKCVTVNISEVKVTGITLNKKSIVLPVGGKETLTAAITPKNATSQAVDWDSSDLSVATVTSLGEITAVAPGTAVITVRALDGSGVRAKCTVTVKTPNKKILVAQGIAKGQTSLKFSWNKVKGAKSYEFWMAKCGGSYKKVKTLDASKTSFIKTKLKKNSAYKFCVIAKDASGKTITKSRTGHAVTGNVRGKYTNAKSLKLSKTKVTLAKGGKAKIKATQTKAVKGKALLKHCALLRYASENEAVATVDSKGNIKGVGTGTCRIIVQTVNGICKTVTVTVK